MELRGTPYKLNQLTSALGKSRPGDLSKASINQALRAANTGLHVRTRLNRKTGEVRHFVVHNPGRKPHR